MRTLRYFICIIIAVAIPFVSFRSIAFHQEIPFDKNVIRVETENNILFIYNSDTIFVSKTIKDISSIFQIVQLHELFFKDQGYHSISIRSLLFELKHSNKKKKYFKAEGFVPNLLNQYEWLIKLENGNAKRNMILEEFIKDAGAALVEIKIQI